MSLPSDPIDLTILLRHEVLQGCINEDRNAEGVLPEHLNFQQVLSCLEEHDLRGPMDDESSRRLEFSFPANYFVSMEEFLLAPARRVTAPKDFYIEELSYRHSRDGAAPPQAVAAYLHAVRLFSLLAQVADDKRQVGSVVTLVFLNQQKLEITADYQLADLGSLSSLDTFEQEYIASPTHQQQKHTIFRSALFGMFSSSREVALADLINRFPELVEHVESSYQLYVSEFSFQKIKAEVEREKLEFTAKLNKVFSDIQNQLLAVPAALILVGGQMEAGLAWSVKNLLVWFGAVVFSILMNLLIRNQHHTLNAVKLEIDQQWQLIQGKHRQVAQQFRTSYTQLYARYNHQRILLGTVSALVAVALAFATGLLLWYSVPNKLALQSMGAAVCGGALLYPAVKATLWARRRCRPTDA